MQPDISNSWADMLKVYAEPDVADACLKLQSQFNLDVTMFLATLIASQKGCLIDEQAIQRLNTACKDWRAQVVHPLRAIRQKLKAAPLLSFQEDADVFREKVKALELNAERIQFNIMHDILNSLDWCDRANHKNGRLLIIARKILISFHPTHVFNDLPEVILIIQAIKKHNQ